MIHFIFYNYVCKVFKKKQVQKDSNFLKCNTDVCNARTIFVLSKTNAFFQF